MNIDSEFKTLKELKKGVLNTTVPAIEVVSVRSLREEVIKLIKKWIEQLPQGIFMGINQTGIADGRICSVLVVHIEKAKKADKKTHRLIGSIGTFVYFFDITEEDLE